MSKGCTGGGLRPSLASVNPSLTCALCKGYLVNAMTLIRCMHSFCKSCIHRHLDTSSACPTCQLRVFRSRMDLHMVADNTLQAIVYKTVPGLFANEMRRRWDFYEQNEDSPDAIRDREPRNTATSVAVRQIFTEEDCVSLALEHRQEAPGVPKFLNMYLRCRADVPIRVIIKFVRNKFSPPASLAVHLHLEKLDINKPKLTSKGARTDSIEGIEDKDKDRLLLDPDLTLIDVCYMADYKFEGPLTLSFKFVEFDPALCSKAKTLYESLAPLESKITTKNNLNSKQQQQRVNGKHVVIANGGVLSSGSNVQYGKYKVDTKSIDMARGALLNGGVSTTKGSNSGTSKSRTYSRAGGAGGPMITTQLGQLSQLKSLAALGSGMLENCNHETTGDSTEEEEADNWDSNVSTTIDRTLTTQQQQQQQHTSIGNKAGNSKNSNNANQSNNNNSNSNKQQRQHQQHQSLVNGNGNDKNRCSAGNHARSSVQYNSSQNSTKHSRSPIVNPPPLSAPSDGQVQMANGVSTSNISQQRKNQAIVVARPQTLKMTPSQGSVDATVPHKESPSQTQPASAKHTPHSNVGNKAGSASVSSSTTSPIDKERSLSVGKQAVRPVAIQQSSVGHHKTGQGHRNNHKNSSSGLTSSSSGSSSAHHHHHGHHGGTHKSSHLVPSVVLSPTTASASTVAGKPPTVLKIKLNTSPTTCETLTITSPPLRDNRHTTFEKSSTTPKSGLEPEYPAVTSIKIKPIVAPPSGPVTRKSPSPPSTRDTRGSAVDGSRKKRKSDEERKHQTPPDEKKTKKAKTKKGSSSQAVINNAAFVSEQATDLLGTQNFGWGSAALLWESQLRIPSPLTVPFTVSFARRQANQLKEREKAEKTKLQITESVRESANTDKDKFLETNFQLSKQPVVVKQPQNRIWRMPRQVSSPPPSPIKLPPPDFVMSSTLEAVLNAIADDKLGDESDDAPRAEHVGGNADNLTGACRSQSDSELFSDSMRLGSSPSGDINADVFRMEFPVAAAERASPANLLSSPCTSASSAASICPAERSQSFSTLATSCALLHIPTEVMRRHSASGPEMKFSICSILSDAGGQKVQTAAAATTPADAPAPPAAAPTAAPAVVTKEPNVQETIEMCITNLSRFFWALESCSERTRCRLAEVCLFKRLVLEKILALVRKLTIVVSPNQIERVLQLESAVERYFLEPPTSSTASVSLLMRPEDITTNTEPFVSTTRDDDLYVEGRLSGGFKESVDEHSPKRRDEESLKTVLDANDNRSEKVIDLKPTASSVISERNLLDNSQDLKMETSASEDAVDVKRELPEKLDAPKAALKQDDDAALSNEIRTAPCKPDTKATEFDDITDKPAVNGDHTPKNEILTDSDQKANQSEHKIDDVSMSVVSSALIDVLEEIARLAEMEHTLKVDEGAHETIAVVPAEDDTRTSMASSPQPMSVCGGDIDHMVTSADPAMDVDECSTSSEILNAESDESAIRDTMQMVADSVSTKVFPEGIKNPYGFPGSFGYNMCKLLVPYVPINRSIRVSCRGPEAIMSLLNATAISAFFYQPQSIPFRRGDGFEAISTCAPYRSLPKESMELVLYQHRSSDIMEHLFHLAGLIPDRVPIPLQVHDYILQARPEYTIAQTAPATRKRPLSTEGTETETDPETESKDDVNRENHPLFELIKRRALEVPSLPNTSPTFGDFGDMDVHRWEEVGVQGVQPPASLGNALPGSLNVH